MPKKLTNRILIIGVASFLSLHLCEKLLEVGQKVICAYDLYTAAKQNIVHREKVIDITGKAPLLKIIHKVLSRDDLNRGNPILSWQKRNF